MININQKKITQSGFYFMSYNHNSINSVGVVESELKQLKVISDDILVLDDNETISGYPDAMFSLQLPDYVTNKFSKLVNDVVRSHMFDVTLKMATNDVAGYDETFSVFVLTPEPSIHIITQHINGKTETTVLRGKESINVLSSLLV